MSNVITAGNNFSTPYGATLIKCTIAAVNEFSTISAKIHATQPIKAAFVAVTPWIATILAGANSTGGATLVKASMVGKSTYVATIAAGANISSPTGSTLVEALIYPRPNISAGENISGGPLLIEASMTGKVGQGAQVVALVPHPLVATLTGKTGAKGSIAAGHAASTPYGALLLKAALTGGVNQIIATTPKVVANLVGVNGVVATVAGPLKRISASLVGTTWNGGSIKGPLPLLRESLTAYQRSQGAVVAALPRSIAKLYGSAGVSGRIAAGLPHPSLAVLGTYTRTTGSVLAKLPRTDCDVFAYSVTPQLAVLVCGTTNGALSQYINYPYNSFADAGNGVYYAAGPTGIYQVDSGGTDNGTAIAALVTFGKLHFNSEYMKKIANFYIAMRSQNPMTLSIYADESPVPQIYTIDPVGISTLKQRRVKTALGARAKYWQVSLANVRGGYFDFDSINIEVADTTRRV